MTAPYAASFGSLDPHTTPRAQDDIVGKALHRTLYNWDSTDSKLVLELAKSVTPSEDGLTYTYKLRDDAYFHNGRKMTADDIIWSLHAHHGRQQGLPGRALRARHQGRGRRREGPGEGDFGPEEDRRLHARDDADRHASIPATPSSSARRRSCPRRRSRRATSPPIPSASGPFKFKEHIPGSRVVAERFDKFYKPGKPYADKLEVADHGRGRRARRRLPQQGDRHLDPGPGAVRRLSRGSAALEGHPRSRRDVHPRHDLQPRATSRSRTSACARRSTTPSTPT